MSHSTSTKGGMSSGIAQNSSCYYCYAGAQLFNTNNVSSRTLLIHLSLFSVMLYIIATTMLYKSQLDINTFLALSVLINGTQQTQLFNISYSKYFVYTLSAYYVIGINPIISFILLFFTQTQIIYMTNMTKSTIVSVKIQLYNFLLGSIFTTRKCILKRIT